MEFVDVRISLDHGVKGFFYGEMDFGIRHLLFDATDDRAR
jgi:hypothetical protein